MAVYLPKCMRPPQVSKCGPFENDYNSVRFYPIICSLRPGLVIGGISVGLEPGQWRSRRIFRLVAPLQVSRRGTTKGASLLVKCSSGLCYIGAENKTAV